MKCEPELKPSLGFGHICEPHPYLGCGLVRFAGSAPNHGITSTGSKLIVISFPFACQIMKWSCELDLKSLTAQVKRGVTCLHYTGRSWYSAKQVYY